MNHDVSWHLHSSCLSDFGNKRINITWLCFEMMRWNS